MKKQMKAIDLHARKLGYLVPGEGPGTATAGDCHRKGPALASRPFFS
jgi:hypothetical protein